MYLLKSLNQLIESEHATDETNGLMLVTFHACREETEAIIREGGDFFFYHTFLYCIVNNSSFPSNYSMHASFSCYIFFFSNHKVF